MGILVHGDFYSHRNARSALMLFVVLFLQVKMSAIRKRSIGCLKVNDEYSAIDAFVDTPPCSFYCCTLFVMVTDL